MLILSSFALLYPLSTLVRARLATCCFDASACALYCFLMLLLLRRDACVACTHGCRHCFRVWLHACRLRPPVGTTDGCTWTDARTHDPAMTASSRRPGMCSIRSARDRAAEMELTTRSTLTFSDVFATENGQSIEKVSL